jgi:hypothetical protein
MSSIYHADSIVDLATATAALIEEDMKKKSIIVIRTCFNWDCTEQLAVDYLLTLIDL